MIDNIHKVFDNRQDSLLIPPDISKACDRVRHQGLLLKFKQRGIIGTLLNWFNSYHSNRHQHVCVGGSYSSLKNTNAAVPQGSILGPILLLVYVSDMCSNLVSDPHQFADDTMLIFTFIDPLSAAIMVNSDIYNLSRWRVTFNLII